MVTICYNSKTDAEKKILEKYVDRFMGAYVFRPTNCVIHVSMSPNDVWEVVEIKISNTVNIEKIVAIGEPTAKLEQLDFRGVCSLRLGNITYMIGKEE